MCVQLEKNGLHALVLATSSEFGQNSFAFVFFIEARVFTPLEDGNMNKCNFKPKIMLSNVTNNKK